MGEQKPHISVVLPCYRTADCLQELHRRLVASLTRLAPAYEIIFVNDGSPDRDWEVITELCAHDPHVIGINLSRNFGQHTAITAGLDHTRGEWVVVMDADLQDQPEEIEALYRTAQEGYEVVFGMRQDRQDSFLKVLSSRAFSWMFNRLSAVKFKPTASNFSISREIVIQNFRRLRERSRAFGLNILWLGFRVGYVPVKHSERYAGSTSYSLSKSVQLAIDSIVSQSDRPLRFFIKFGLGISLISALIAIYYTFRYFVFHSAPAGWTSTIVSIFFLCGLLFANLGIIGLYLGKTFEECKDRPLYIIREVTTAGEVPSLPATHE